MQQDTENKIKGLDLIKGQCVMDLQSDINWIQSEVGKVRDPQLIMAFKSMLNYRNNRVSQDWWEIIGDEEKSEIDEGLAQLDKGEFVSHGEVMKNARKWV